MRAAGKADAGAPRRRRRRATYTRRHAVRHLIAGQDLSTDRLYLRLVPPNSAFWTFVKYRPLHPFEVRIAIVLDKFSQHRSTRNDGRVSNLAAANNVELAYTPTSSSWLDRIETQFSALHHFALDNTDHAAIANKRP